MTCRRRINSARLPQDLTKARQVVMNDPAENTEHVEPCTEASRGDIPGDQSDDETASSITTDLEGGQTQRRHRSTD